MMICEDECGNCWICLDSPCAEYCECHDCEMNRMLEEEE